MIIVKQPAFKVSATRARRLKLESTRSYERVSTRTQKNRYFSAHGRAYRFLRATRGYVSAVE
jgi:hypothetical protein